MARAKTSGGWRAGRWLALLVVGVCACSAEPDGDDGGDRLELVASSPAAQAGEGPFARRFLPFDPVWRPLFELPAEPQESPEMVIWEVSEYPEGAQPSVVQRRAADDLVKRCYQAAVRNGWLDFDKALADGYMGLFQDRRHYGNWEFIADDQVLDPDRPEFLMYYASPEGMQLIGFMFYTSELLAHGPQIGGPLSVWHYHIWTTSTCLRGNLLPIGQVLESGRCLAGEPSHRSPEMVHVWLVDRREGPFFTGMYIEPKRLAGLLTKRTKERGEPW